MNEYARLSCYSIEIRAYCVEDRTDAARLLVTFRQHLNSRNPGHPGRHVYNDLVRMFARDPKCAANHSTDVRL